VCDHKVRNRFNRSGSEPQFETNHWRDALVGKDVHHSSRKDKAEVEAREYADFEDLRANITRFIERYYNGARLHSSLGYRSPAEFDS